MSIWKNYKADMDSLNPSRESVEASKIHPRKRKHFTGNPVKRIPALAAVLALVVVATFALAAIPGTQIKTFKNNEIRKASNYAQLYNEINEKIKSMEYVGGGVREDVIYDDIGTAVPPGNTNGASPEHSDTNLQVAGVQEADIVKNDGNYIYALAGNTVYIIKAKDGILTPVSTFSISGDQAEEKPDYDEKIDYSYNYSIDMYATRTRLIVLKSNYYRSYNNSYKNITYAEIYDISDRENPEFIATLGQDGYNLSSRMIGDTLYLISSYYVYEIDPDKTETFVPAVYADENSSLIPPEDISICPVYNYINYTVVSGIDTVKGERVSNTASLGSAEMVYANTQNLYIAGASYETVEADNKITEKSSTLIQRYTLDDGRVEFTASGTVSGRVLNQFSMDEHKGFFRIVTTVNSYSYTRYNDTIVYDTIAVSDFQNNQTNSLYILNNDLEVVGKIEGLAKEERVYSVRFDGDYGYFVTFRQVDPLFTVDLSDPANPVILSQLKIPGFSDYLHKFDNGLLFGLGRNGNDEGSIDYLKLSMFDISDPTDVKEINKEVITGEYYSQASYNHKAILINAEKNIIAFPADRAVYVYSYTNEEGFVLKAKLAFENTDDENAYWYYSYNGVRTLYIGDYFYVVTIGIDRCMATSYDMTEFNIKDTVKPE